MRMQGRADAARSSGFSVSALMPVMPGRSLRGIQSSSSPSWAIPAGLSGDHGLIGHHPVLSPWFWGQARHGRRTSGAARDRCAEAPDMRRSSGLLGFGRSGVILVEIRRCRARRAGPASVSAGADAAVQSTHACEAARGIGRNHGLSQSQQFRNIPDAFTKPVIYTLTGSRCALGLPDRRYRRMGLCRASGDHGRHPAHRFGTRSSPTWWWLRPAHPGNVSPFAALVRVGDHPTRPAQGGANGTHPAFPKPGCRSPATIC